MARYRKVDVCIWGDKKFAALSPPRPSAQFLWFNLLTGMHTCAIPGLSTAGEAMLAEVLRWPLPAFRRCWQEIEAQGMAEADWRARVIYLPKAIAYNEPESPNVVKAWRELLPEIPECPLKSKAVVRIGKYLEGMGASWLEAWSEGWSEAFREAFSEALPEGSTEASPEGSPEAMTESGTGAGTGAVLLSSRRRATPAAAVPEDIQGWLRGTVNLQPLAEEQHGNLWVTLVKAYDRYAWLYFETEIEKADTWITANPNRAPTVKGLPRFMRNWFDRAVEIGRRQQAHAQAPRPTGPRATA